jgi:hypothetical protein
VKTREISNRDDVIDSRDVIARIEELESEMTDAMGEWQSESELTKPQALIDWEAEGFMDELEALRKLRDDADGSPDWEYGETLIRESYFTDYIEELIDDCYSLPKEMNSGEWPWRHMKIDFEAAADEARADYIEADFNGVTYLIRA